ncbi:MAG: efflux RND transporter permease subunit [Acidobacteria bacterium]|nr:efflux RND transporter permease subunit [Acidobacteriota bacterium]
MLRALVEFSIRFRGVVTALACVVVGYGLYVWQHARFDVYPEFAPPQVVIQTEAPGLSPEEVEQLVTRLVESAVNGAGNLESIRSQSIQGLSVVTAIFREGTEIYRARQVVGERLAETIGQMPQGVKSPTMAPLTSASSMMLAIGLTSEKRSLMELRTFADWTIRPRLLGVPGVAKVVVFGGEVRQLQVQVRPERLLAFDLGIEDVLAATRRATAVRGAGFVETEAQRIVLQTQGQSVTPEEMGEVILARHNGTSLRLKDVTRVAEGPVPKIGDAGIGGRPGVLLVVSSQLGANTMEVTAAAERALEEMKSAVKAEQITLHPGLFRPANFIETALHNVNFSLLVGGVLVAVVLFLFLFNVRTAFISLTAIPLSLLIAVIILDRYGATINTLALGGLAIAIGEVVDDAIIDVENIFRRLRENEANRDPKTAFRVVLDASLEVRSAVVYATFVVALVFLPVLTMTGLQGRLFAPLGIAYILAILASLAVALTVTPALCYLLLPQAAKRASEPPFVTVLKVQYGRTLQKATARPGLVMGLAFALGAGAATTLPFLGGGFLPELREGHFIVHMYSAPGTSFQESFRLGRLVTRELLRDPRIRSVSQQIGRAEKADDTWGPHYSEFHVDLNPLGGRELENVQGRIREALEKFPGIYFSIKPFLTERIEETLSGVTAQVAIKIFGDDLDAIDQKAREVAQVVSAIGGAADVQVDAPPGAPQFVIRLRPERLKQFGFHPLDALEAVQAAYQGVVVGETYQANYVFDVAVILDEKIRRDPEAIGAMILRNEEGLRIPLHELAEVYQTTGRYVVLHDGARRRTAVTCNVRGRDLRSFVAEARRQVGKMNFPAGIYAIFSGADEARERAQRELLLNSTIAGIGIILLLSIVFKNWRNLALVLANLPFALVGGVLAVFFTGGWLSVGSLVGFVTLFGITARNSMMLVSHFEHLVKQEGMTWGLEAALRGTSERFVPVMMTALVTTLGLLPLAVGSGEPGREIEGPMAIVIVGGLATSTVLNLLVLPALALRYGRFAAPQEPGNPA